jgi:hypothetical protein
MAGGIAPISNEERAPLLFAYLMAHYRPAFEVDNIVVLKQRETM